MQHVFVRKHVRTRLKLLLRAPRLRQVCGASLAGALRHCQRCARGPASCEPLASEPTTARAGGKPSPTERKRNQKIENKNLAEAGSRVS